MRFSVLRDPRFVLVITLLVVIPFIAYDLLKPQLKPKVLAQNTINQTIASPSPVLQSTPPASPLPSVAFLPSAALAKDGAKEGAPALIPSKAAYTIAVIGDSMVDTMGDNLPYLNESLRARYQTTNFKLYNYGIGGENVAPGLARFDDPYSYQNRNYPAINKLPADIIIVASFAYNPFSPHDRDRHWLTLTELVNQAKKTGADVYLLAEIAPLGNNFGAGKNGINWPPDLARKQSLNIIEQLENAVALANALNVLLIDAFHKSQIDGQFGLGEFVDGNDGIHPSVTGHQLMADLIAQTLKLP